MATQAGSQTQAASNQDDRIWAAVAHGTAFLVGFGPIFPLIVWSIRRRKSGYAAFQALQAMLYQSLFFWTWVLLIPLLTVVVLVIMFLVAMPLAKDQNSGFLISFLPQLLIWGAIIGAFAIYAGIGLWGAIASLLGHDFRYPFFGDRLARRLEYHGAEIPSLPEDKEDDVVGAVCHSTCALPFWGLITPIIAWFTQHERSTFLRFQALQALVYQAIGLMAYVLFMMLYMVFTFGFMGLALLASGPGPSATPAWMVLATLPALAILCVFALGAPAFQVLGFVAAVRVLGGHDFHYPLLGSFLASKLKPTEAK